MKGPDSLSARFREWGNRPSVAIFWAVVGCACSFCCPFFLGLEKWQAVGDLSYVRLMIMLLSCAAAAAVYRVGFLLRYHEIMREKPTLFGMILGTLISGTINAAFGVIFFDWGTWPNVVGLELLAVAVFGMLEMARPFTDFYLLRFFLCLPVIAALRRHDWNFVDLGWPVLAVPVLAFLLLMWREFFLSPVEDYTTRPDPTRSSPSTGLRCWWS